MHCVTSYPVKDEEANLMVIQNLKKNFKKCIIGYSDHTIGPTASLSSFTWCTLYRKTFYNQQKLFKF